MPGENQRDELFTCLSNARRRALIDSLESQRTPVSDYELARQVAAREEDSPADDLSTETIRDVHLSLYHVHLPKLASADVIEYDRARNEVGRGPAFEAVIVILDEVT